MGSSFSPVVEAFLRGQQQQAGIVQNAQDYKLHKEQVEAAIEEAQKKHEQDQERLALEHQIFELNFKKAQEDTHEHMIEQLRANPSLAPGTTNFPQPDMQMAIPGMPNTTVPRSSMGLPSTSTVTPQPGSPITMDSFLGPMSFNMPKSNQQLAIEQANALIPSKVAEYKATVGNTKEAALESALAIANLKGDFGKQVAEMREESAKYGADQHYAAQMEMERRQLELTMFNLFGPEGVAAVASKDPAMFSGIIGRHATRIGMGLEDETDLPTGLKGAVGTYMGTNNIAKPPKGINEDLSKLAAGGQRLLSDFDNLNTKYPPAKQYLGRVGTGVARVIPTTQTNQDFGLFGSNIASYATLSGLTPGMERSPYLAKKGDQASPGPMDTPDTRLTKRDKLVDLMLSKAAGVIEGLPTQQKIEFWRNFIKDIPQVRTDARYSDILSNILKTGNYTSKYAGTTK